MQAIIGQKSEQMQRFLEDGRRVPVTVLRIPRLSVVQVKSMEKDGYEAVQLGIGTTTETKLSKPVLGHVKKNGAKAPLFLAEITKQEAGDLPEASSEVLVAETFEPGDIVWVTGTSKGKGFAGGVKRYGFRGGPKTHGQSDRHRAPGSIGSGTTPGRVYRGKHMAGNMGNEQVTIKNLLVVGVDAEANTLLLSGLVPGFSGSFVKVVKMGAKKKFTPLLKNEAELAKEAQAAEAVAAPTEAPVAAETVVTEAVVETPAEEAKESFDKAQAVRGSEEPSDSRRDHGEETE